MSDRRCSPDEHDVVIAGGGPVGMTLALGLARAGLDVLVLEKEASTTTHSRAPVIWPGTQAVLDRYGVFDRFAERGFRLPCPTVWDADRNAPLLALPLTELAGETPHPHLLVLPQSDTEALLCEEIRNTVGVEIRFSCKVTGLIQDSFGVDVVYRRFDHEERVRAKYVAGCDGAHSTVRDHIAGRLEGKTYGFKAVLADILLPGLEDLDFPRISTSPRLVMALRLKPDLWRLVFPYSGTREPDPGSWISQASMALFSREPEEIVWQDDFCLHRRVSSHWVKGRIVLAGDAAHLNSPVGGEGLNAGIQDAALLSRALENAVAVDHPQPLVDYVTYRRRSVERGVNAFTDMLTRILLFDEGRMIRPAFALARVLFAVPGWRRRILRRLALVELG